MLKVNVYNLEGQVIGEEQLDGRLFGVRPEPTLIQQAVVAAQANTRTPLAHTKTRGEVRGGGRKPWRQKGTGRARQGSIRAPQWRGGGVVFGPRATRHYGVRLNAKMKRRALLMSLSDKARNGRLILLRDLEASGKTKEFAHTLRSFWRSVAPDARRLPSALVIMPTIPLSLKRSTANLPAVEAIRADSLNVPSVLRHTYAVATVDGIKRLTGWLLEHQR